MHIGFNGDGKVAGLQQANEVIHRGVDFKARVICRGQNRGSGGHWGSHRGSVRDRDGWSHRGNGFRGRGGQGGRRGLGWCRGGRNGNSRRISFRPKHYRHAEGEQDKEDRRGGNFSFGIHNQSPQQGEQGTAGQGRARTREGSSCHVGRQPQRGGLDGVGRDGGGKERGGGGDATGSKVVAQFFQGAFDAFVGGVFGEAENGADFLMGFALEKAQHDGVAVGFLELADTFIEQGAQLVPRHCGGGESFIHGEGLLFTGAAALFATDGFAGGKARAGVQPAGEGVPARQRAGLAGEINKNRLRGVLGERGIAIRLAQRDGVNQVYMPTHEFRKGGAGAFLGIPPQ